MTRETRDRFESPLEDHLEQIPPQDPPAELRQQCLARVRRLAQAQQAARPASAWRPVWAALAAGAALTVLMALTLPFWGVAKKATAPPAGRSEMALPSGGGPGAYRVLPGGPPAGPAMSPPSKTPPGPSPSPSAAPTAAPLPARPPIGGAAKPVAGPPVRVQPPAPPPPGMTDRGEYAGGWVSSGHESTELVPPLPEDRREITTPWYDFSGDRQQVKRTQMEVGVPEVDKALDDARFIVEKVGGYLTEVQVHSGADERDRARFLARVPVEDVDHVVEDLGKLGKVRKLTSEAQDVTKPYRAQGGDIRGMGATEDELVARYEQTRDPAERRRLYQQIQSLRQRNAGTKQGLQTMSERTHLAELEVTLVEQATPALFVKRALGSAGLWLAWLAVTAVIWLPLAALGWVLWRKLGR